MSFADDIAEKRKSQAAQQQASSLHDESVNATKDSGQAVVEAFLRGNSGTKDVKIQNQDLAKKDDIDKVLEQLKQLHLTNLLEANKPKPAADTSPRSMLTDSAVYVGDSIEKLSKEIMAKLNDNSLDEVTKSSLTTIKTAIDGLQTAQKGSTDTMAKAIQKLEKSIAAVDVKPVVHVDAPNVTVKAPDVNLQPLQDTLSKYFDNEDGEKVDLECYRAQDLYNSGDLQYVGFLNADGGWYIIENDTKKNRMRYVFGNSGYEDAFSKAASYEYVLLNEAIDALSA